MTVQHAARSPHPADPRRQPAQNSLRVALLTTPRCGNNWVRHLLFALYGMPTRSVHSPADIDWENLSSECVLGLHWHAEPAFVEALAGHGFQVVVLARHPLDTLLSVLQFALHSPTDRWLEGEGGDERSVYGTMPRSEAFLEYATGPRAKALLSVSQEWWQAPGSVCFRYEDLVEDLPGELNRLIDVLGVEPRRPLSEAIEATTLEQLRRETHCPHHFWQGRPGLWRGLLTEAEARRIAAAHPGSFTTFGYTCDADPDLTPAEADRNWVQLTWSGLAEKIQELPRARARIEDLEHAVRREQGEHDRTRRDLEGHKARVLALEQLGPVALGAARTIHGWSLRHPRLAGLARRLVRCS
jgi:hypothetical protein